MYLQSYTHCKKLSFFYSILHFWKLTSMLGVRSLSCHCLNLVLILSNMTDFLLSLKKNRFFIFAIRFLFGFCSIPMRLSSNQWIVWHSCLSQITYLLSIYRTIYISDRYKDRVTYSLTSKIICERFFFFRLTGYDSHLRNAQVPTTDFDSISALCLSQKNPPPPPFFLGVIT